MFKKSWRYSLAGKAKRERMVLLEVDHASPRGRGDSTHEIGLTRTLGI